MVQEIDVLTGMVAVGGADSVLKVGAIGSCVAVSAYDRDKKIGGLAHIMLPGTASESTVFEKTKYADNALREMLKRMSAMGADVESVEVCLIGGANVLKDPDGAIGRDNIKSISEFFEKRKISIQAQSIGGTERRSVIFDVNEGILTYTQGDGDRQLLWPLPQQENNNTSEQLN